MSLVDRAAKYKFLGRVEQKPVEAVGSIIVETLDPDEVLVHTITADNGKEFADNIRVAGKLPAGF